jgi:threonine aldolase
MTAAAIRIDLVSDTSTKPSAAMRTAMANAEVGDEQRGEDPTVNRLCERVAELLGKEAAMFLPSGTMCNQIAILTHCRPGDEIIAAEDSHIIDSEGAGAAVLAGSAIRAVPGEHGVFDARAVFQQSQRRRSQKTPRTRLVSVEQTHNRGGGRVWPLAALQEVAEAARRCGYSMHMDGARLINAVVASNQSASDFAATCDSVWLDLSKGLGCPIGGVLASSRTFIEEAWVWKHRLGGAMRQAGIVAAAGLYALDHNVARLAEDHGNARLFAERVAALPGVRLAPADIHTNLVFFDTSAAGITAKAMSAALLARGIRIGVEGEHKFRAVTHLDVDRDAVEEAAAAFADILARHA